MIIEDRHVEDRHLTKMMFTDANLKPNQNQTGGLKQTSSGDTSRSPDLMV